MLCKLARIPDLSKAEAGTIDQLSWPLALRHILVLTNGRGTDGSPHWKVGENPDGSLRILLDGLWPVTLYPAGSKDSSRLSGKWCPIRKASMAREAVREAQETGDGDTGGGMFGDSSGDSMFDGNVGGGMFGEGIEADEDGGQLLLRAAFFHAAGDRDTASQIAGSLLANQNRGKRAIAGAFSLAAQRQHRYAVLRYTDTGDRPAFVADLREIRNQFPRGWSGGLVLDCIIEAMQVPQEPSQAVLALSPEDQKLIAELIAETPQTPRLGCNDWLLFVPPELARAPSSALVRLLRKGLDAVPILRAMTKDTRATRYLTTPTEEPTREMVERILQRALAEAGGDEAQDMLLDEMDAVSASSGDRPPELLYPMSAGCLALNLLKLIVTEEHANVWQVPRGDDSEHTLSRATKLYRTYHGRPRVDIAHKLLAVPEARATAIKYLLARPRAEEDYAEIEEAVLQLNDYRQMQLLNTLANVRGEKAGPVIDKAIERTQGSDDAEWLLPQLKAIRAMATGGDGTIDQFRDRLRKASGNDGSLYLLMQNSHRFGDRQAVADVLLTEAATTADPEKRGFLLGFLGHVARSPANRARSEGPLLWGEFGSTPSPTPAADNAAEEKPLELDLKHYASAWRKVLPGSPPPDSILLDQAVSPRSAFLPFLRMYDSDPAAQSRESIALLGTLPDGGVSILFRRVQTILEGDTNPPWPDPADIPEERIAKISETLAKLPVAEARRQAIDLPANEHLALLQELPVRKELARHLRAETGWTLPPPKPVGALLPDVRDAFVGLAGKGLSADLGKEMLATGKRLVVEGHPFVFLFQVGPGLRISCELASLDPEAKPGTDKAALLEQYRLLANQKPGTGVHMLLRADGHYRVFETPQQPAQTKKTNTKTKKMDQILADPEDLDRLFDGDDAESDASELLQALDTPPEALADPMRVVSLVLVGLDEKAYERLRDRDDDEP